MSEKTQSGNVLFLILIAVALFAALSYVVSQSSRSGAGNVDKEKASIEFNVIHGHSVSIKTAIARMQAAKVGVEQLDFRDTGFTVDYTNPNCPNNICKVFHPLGGGAAWSKPPQGFNDGSDYIISGYSQVQGIGYDDSASADASDLLMIVPNVAESICGNINQILTRSTDIPTLTSSCIVDTGGTDFYFRGTFATGHTVSAAGNALNNVFERCVRCTGSPATYHYYMVLIAR